MTKFKLVCERETGEKIESAFDSTDRERLQKLADTLNKRFSHRRYYVQTDKPEPRRANLAA